MGYNLAMVYIIVGSALILTGLTALSLQRFYSAISAHELKRLAARGDHMAAKLFRPVAYGSSLRLFLWMIFGLSLAFGLAMFSDVSQQWFFVVVVISLVAIIWLWTARLTVHTAQFAVWCAPPIVKIMSYAHRPLNFVTRSLGRLRVVDAHTGLYENDDIVALIRQQKDQPDSRITMAQLDLIESALLANDLKAADLIIDWKNIKPVSNDDKIGPILLSELHKSGQNVFVVYKDKPENVVGSLTLADAISAKAGGNVADIMRPNISYVHEDFNLHQIFQAFAHGGRAMVVVINSVEEAVGVITLQNALMKLLGQLDAEPLAYEDRKSIASWRPQANPEPATVPVVDELPPETSSEPTEVVE